MSINGKVALITGGSRGLGKSFCRALLDKGVKVTLADVDITEGEKTLREFQRVYGRESACFVPCDVTKEEQIEDAIVKTKQTFGQLDILCNNAGIMDESSWRKMVDINVNGVISGTLLGLKHMGVDQGGKGGTIINVASMAGIFAMDVGPVYCGSKHAVLGFSRAAAAPINFKQHRVRINCLCPGITETPLLDVKEGALLHVKRAKKLFNALGIQQPGIVAEAFMQLVEDPNQLGTVLKVNAMEGIQPKKYKDITPEEYIAALNKE